jgi:hypothetical protein
MEPKAVNQTSSLIIDSPNINKKIKDSIGGLAVSPDQNEKQSKAKRKSAGPKRMRKRRKVVIDNDNTQLSGEHIKSMLDDTSETVMQGRIHPADFSKNENKSIERLDLRRRLPFDRLMVRPQLADDAALVPDILQLWLKNTAEARGLHKAVSLRIKAGEKDTALQTIEAECPNRRYGSRSSRSR